MLMKIPTLFSLGLVLALLLVGVFLNALSIVSLIRLDHIVHNNLYSYGLRLDPAWATQYWTYAKSIIILLVVAIMQTSLLIPFILVNWKNWSAHHWFSVGFLLMVGNALTGFSIALFTDLDQIVHGDLYRYGLLFDYMWADPYWDISSTMLRVMGSAIIATSISVGLIFLKAYDRMKVKRMRVQG
jgi:hypothetical protein